MHYIRTSLVTPKDTTKLTNRSFNLVAANRDVAWMIHTATADSLFQASKTKQKKSKSAKGGVSWALQSRQYVSGVLHELVEINDGAAAPPCLLPEEHLQLPHFIKRPHVCKPDK